LALMYIYVIAWWIYAWVPLSFFHLRCFYIFGFLPRNHLTTMKVRQVTHAVWTKFLGSAQKLPGGNEGPPGDMNWIGSFSTTLWFLFERTHFVLGSFMQDRWTFVKFYMFECL